MISADQLRQEAAHCLDAAALQLHRASDKLRRANEINQSVRITDTKLLVRSYRDALLGTLPHHNVPPDETKRVLDEPSA